MRTEQQPAFVLHARAYRETSLLLECLTRDHGRIGLIARGVRRERARTPRALLQPLIPIQLGWNGRGELATLTQVEAIAPGFDLAGDALFCSLYLNELVLRITPRQDPQPELFADYAETLARLARGEPQAWTLRRFERDLLGHLGYGLVLDVEGDSGAALNPEADYGYRHEHGPELWHGTRDGVRLRGAALLALARDEMPASEHLPSLRRLMRAVIAGHLDGGELRSWSMLV
ncbi:MAG: DNA repair protein RecO [Rudaea sp.]|uniref:DNA repair protein RecO n=1 Tax=unclassified Rudaea TaxID=2627037 RepID=UPI0010FA1A0C|nr:MULTISPECIES: DNA repair protein RecO [unclassified Rudaea]MBN8884680.1 DNA repair protein RecO [Rudaea sp.]